MSTENVKIGETYVCRWGYSMVLYDFYKVVRKTEHSVRLQKMKKLILGNLNSWHCPVKPSTEVIEEKTYRLCKDGTVRLGHGSYLWFDNWRIYDKDKTYAEDHMD